MVVDYFGGDMGQKRCSQCLVLGGHFPLNGS